MNPNIWNIQQYCRILCRFFPESPAVLHSYLLFLVSFIIFCPLSVLHWVRYHIGAFSSSCLTILQCGSSHLCGRGTCPSAVAGLYYDPILGELLQVVQNKVLCVISCGLHANHTELVVSTRAVLSVAHLVAPDGSILQVLLGCLAKERRGLFEIMVMNVPAFFYFANFSHSYVVFFPWVPFKVHIRYILLFFTHAPDIMVPHGANVFLIVLNEDLVNTHNSRTIYE